MTLAKMSPNGSQIGLPDEIAARIHELIFTGDFPAGARLGQDKLARRSRVSRTPIREALRQLSAVGAVELQPNRGAIVRPITRRDLVEGYLLRAELEGVAAELALPPVGDERF